MSTPINSTAGVGLRVAVYYRMSDDEQKMSIDRQQREVRSYVGNRGYIVADGAEYIDRGKSGSKEVEKRTAFHRMIADASKGKWNAIVCYDTSRFGRLDTLTGAKYKDALRKHGVWLETVTEGKIDWTTSMGRIQDALFSERDHEYSIKLSASAVSGRHNIAEQGYWPVGEIPFGYDRTFVEGGTVRMRITRRDKFTKPRNWHTKLAINDAEAEVVKRIYSRFADASVSVRGLCKELNEAGELSPEGNGWSVQTLSKTLSEWAYVGICRIGYGRQTREAHRRMEQKEIAGACPSIIDRKLFDTVQAKITERRAKGTNSHQRRAGALSGVLICGVCGCRMTKRDVGKSIRYVCTTANKRAGGACRQWTAREDDLIPVIVDELLAGVDAELLAKFEAKPQAKRGKDIERLKADVAKLEKDYERARSNLRLADPELFADMQRDVLAMKAELDKARNTIILAENENAVSDWASVREWWQGVKGTLIRMSGGSPRMTGDGRIEYGEGYSFYPHSNRPKLATPEAFRSLLETLRTTVTLHWTPRGERYFALSHGVLRAEIDGFRDGDELGSGVFRPRTPSGTGGGSGENVSGEGTATVTQKIIVERTITFALANRATDGRYRGRNPKLNAA